MGPLLDANVTDRLLQSFWDEAGSYGARIVIVPSAAADTAAAARMQAWFTAAEADTIEILDIPNRRAAADPALLAQVENATGILITDGNPLRFTSLLGGTPLAQAIRRANARGRVVGGIGRGGAVLCQHMIAIDDHARASTQFLNRALIQFAPGLGIINRLALDCGEEAGSKLSAHPSRLPTAVSYNPFLVGIAIDPDTGIVVYANSTLEVFGAGSALVVDGSQIEYADIDVTASDAPMNVTGIAMHVLGAGYTYNLDTHSASGPPESEIPRAGYEAYTSF
jgi:cyanophycinase